MLIFTPRKVWQQRMQGDDNVDLSFIDYLAQNYVKQLPMIFGKWKYLKESKFFYAYKILDVAHPSYFPQRNKMYFGQFGMFDFDIDMQATFEIQWAFLMLNDILTFKIKKIDDEIYDYYELMIKMQHDFAQKFIDEIVFLRVLFEGGDNMLVETVFDYALKFNLAFEPPIAEILLKDFPQLVKKYDHDYAGGLKDNITHFLNTPKMAYQNPKQLSLDDLHPTKSFSKRDKDTIL